MFPLRISGIGSSEVALFLHPFKSVVCFEVALFQLRFFRERLDLLLCKRCISPEIALFMMLPYKFSSEVHSLFVIILCQPTISLFIMSYMKDRPPVLKE